MSQVTYGCWPALLSRDEVKNMIKTYDPAEDKELIYKTEFKDRRNVVLQRVCIDMLNKLIASARGADKVFVTELTVQSMFNDLCSKSEVWKQYHAMYCGRGDAPFTVPEICETLMSIAELAAGARLEKVQALDHTGKCYTAFMLSKT